MTEEKELEMWREEWQSLGGKEGLMKDLAAQAVKDAKRIHRTKLMEVVASVAVCAFWLWTAIASRGKPINVAMCSAMFLFAGIWLTRLFTLRAEEEGTATDDFIALRRKRLELDLRWNAFSRRATIGLGIAITPWAGWMLYLGRDFYRAEPWRAVVGFGGIVVILGIMRFGLARKRTKLIAEREQFETLVAERTLV